jgi:hypothetical protein
MSRASPRYHRVNPPLPVVGNSNGVVLYRIKGLLEGQLTITGFMYSAANNNPTQSQLINLLAAISTNVFGPYKNCLTQDWTCGIETLDVVHRNDIMGVSSTSNGGVQGGRAAGHPPLETSQILIKYTAFKGQHGRGRASLPPPAVLDLTNSTITAAALIAAINTLISQLAVQASDGTNQWTHSVCTRSTVSPKLVTNFAPVHTIILNHQVGTVRRRRIGRGK